MAHFQDSFWGPNGYDEMHKFVKQGEEFGKELETILAERSDVEKEYVKGLHKLVMKAKKASKKCVGSLQNAWNKMTVELEAEEEIHRSLSFGLVQDCAKQLSSFSEQQIKQRHTVEVQVKERLKVLGEKQKQQIRMKKASHKTCRDLETQLEALADVKAGKGKPMSEKDIGKLERNCQKLEHVMAKNDREFRESNLRTEEARLAWEVAMYRCCQTLESLELERLNQVQNVLTRYSQLVETIIRPTEQTCEELMVAAGEVSPVEDVALICSQLGTGPNQPEQILLDYYEEEIKNSMNADRRCAYLEKKLQGVEDELSRQEKARQGVEGLQKAYLEQPDFTDDKGADDVARQLLEADVILTLLKATHFKLLSAHAEVSKAAQPTSDLSQYIHTTKDKQGMNSSVLRIPLEQISHLILQPLNTYTPSEGAAALYAKPIKKVFRKSHTLPTTNQRLPTESPPPYPDNEWDNNEFDSSAESDGGQEPLGGQESTGSLQFNESENSTEQQDLGQCEAIYDYTANHDDELTLQPGDVINLLQKIDQDWWQGEVGGQIGIFPASYVQKI